MKRKLSSDETYDRKNNGLWAGFFVSFGNFRKPDAVTFFFLEVLASSTASSLTGREVQGAIPVSQTVTSLSSGWAHCHKPGYINNAL